VVQVSDRESFIATRRLTREEGIFCGGSCGLAVAGALKWLRSPAAEHLTEDDIVVVLLPDSGSRYLSKIFDDNWMRENGFLESSTVGAMIADRSREVIAADDSTSVAAAIRLMKTHGISQLPVLDKEGGLHGIISEGDLLDYLLNGGSMDHGIEGLHTHEVATVGPDTPVEELTSMFGRSSAAVVLDEGKVAGIVTKIDVIDFLASRNR
jgi:cystathionine beta-synthase